MRRSVMQVSQFITYVNFTLYFSIEINYKAWYLMQDSKFIIYV